MADLIKGYIQVQIDPLETEASLVFTQDHNGQEWTREKIFILLRDKSIIESINPITLEKALKLFASMQSGTKSMVIAQGIPPELPQHEKLDWQALLIPESLKLMADSIIKSASPPLVYDVKVERKKVEKQAAKKKKFPFLSRKKAKGMVWQNVESKQKISVDPEVIKIGYVEKSSLIAKITTLKIGLPGRSVMGKPIPAPAPEKLKIYYSDGISQRGKEYYADISGFIRIGQNWVDIIPFQPPRLKVYLSPDKTDCLLDFSPGGGEGQVPHYYINTIYKRTQELGFNTEYLLTKQRLQEIIEMALQRNAPFKAFSICKKIDSIIKLTVSEDKLKATLFLKKGRGQNKKLSLSAIGKVIKDAGLKQMDVQRVKRDILDFYKGEKNELKDYLLTEGIPPAKGEEGEISWEIDFLSPEKSNKIKSLIATQENANELIKSLEKYPVSLVQELAEVISEQKIALLTPPTKGETGIDVYGKKLSGIKGDEVPITLCENLRMYGHFVVSKVKGILEKGEKDGTIFLRIRPHQDASASVSISKDKMQAFLTILPPEGSGKHLTLEEIEQIIEEEGVIKGVISEAVKEAVAKAAKEKEVKDMLIAEGKPPLHAKGKRFVLKVKLASGKNVMIRANGKADYRYQDNITLVKRGELLAEITASENEPIDGISVTGKTVPAKKMADAIIPVGRNVHQKVQADGSIKIFARTDGMLEYKKNDLEVKEVLIIKGDVGLKTGNIKFQGSVFIRGSVLSGFSIYAGGDISVGNVIEESLLSADGSIKVNKGIKGSGKAILRAKKDVECLFVENAVILAVGEVKIKKACLRSNIKCNNKLVLGLDKGTIMGGSVKAKKGLMLFNLGAVSEVKTFVAFGQDYLIGDQIELAEKELEKLKKNILDYDKEMRIFTKENTYDSEKLFKIREEKLQTLRTMEKISLRLFTLREKFEEHFPAEITVKGTVYPGVIIETHGRKILIENEKSAVKFVFNPHKGRIEEKQL